MSILNPNTKKIKVGIIGMGNMGQIFLSEILNSGFFDFHNIYVSNRSKGKLERVKEKFGVQTFDNNEELVETCDIIIAAMKPQDFRQTFEATGNLFDKSKILMSLAAGLSIKSILSLLPDLDKVFRIMPNTPASIGKGVLGYCYSKSAKPYESLIQKLLSPMGDAVHVEEGEGFEALTVACGSGVGFIFEFMIYWKEWLEEHGFHEDDAQSLTIDTFLGAALLAKKEETITLEKLLSKVVSAKGVTAAGLSQIREMEVERALRLSFEKAVLRDRDLGKLIR